MITVEHFCKRALAKLFHCAERSNGEVFGSVRLFHSLNRRKSDSVPMNTAIEVFDSCSQACIKSESERSSRRCQEEMGVE